MQGCNTLYFFEYFLPLVEVPPSTLRFLQYYKIILQRPRIIVEDDVRFEHGTCAPEVWRAKYQ